VTREEWDEKWMQVYTALISVGKQPAEAREETERRVTRTFGPRPPKIKPAELKGPSPVDLISLGLKIRKVLKMQKPSIAAVAAAIAAAASAFGAAYGLANADGVILTGEWISIVWAAASALLAGLFTSPSIKPVA
jgi:hypothetical protein